MPKTGTMFELMKTFVTHYRGEYRFGLHELLCDMHDFDILTAEETDELSAILGGKKGRKIK